MKYLIIAFKSRNELQEFVKRLRLLGVAASIINTPHSVSASCGLSARLEYRYLSTCINMLSQTKTTTLIGIYVITRSGVYEQVEKVY